MRDRIFVLFIYLIIILMLVGCWDAREIKDYDLIPLSGIDKVNNHVRLLDEVTISSNSSSDTQSSTSNKSKIFVSEGRSFTEARNSYFRRAEKDQFLGSIRAIIFSENISKGGLEEYLNLNRGLRNINRSAYLFTTNTELDKLLANNQTSGTSIGINLEQLSNKTLKKGRLNNTSLNIVMENALVKHTGYVLNNIDLVNGKIEVDGYSVFKENKKIGFLPASKINGVNYLIVKKPYSEHTVDFDGVRVAFSAQVKNKEIKPFYNRKNINFKIRLVVDCEIIDFSKMTKLNSEKIKVLQNVISKVIRREVISTITISQKKYECDYLQFYKAFRERYNFEFKKMNWNENYKQAKFNVEVKVDVKPANAINLE
ncbi:Ger(x)C family spore germination protein [Microbacteriaceae bacterium 4G12]